MAVIKLQSVTQRQVCDQVIATGLVRNDALQTAQGKSPASLCPSWSPAATYAGPNPFAGSPDQIGNDPYGSRAGRSARHSGNRPERCLGSMSLGTSGPSIRVRKAGACRMPATAG